MAKRNANTELNHDNWNEEEEPQEAGVFVQADNKTMEGRVIKKAKRRGIKNDGGPSLFAGFAGFGKTTSGGAPEPEAAASFDFLKKPSNGSENGGKSESAASFDFATPASQTPSLFAFGSANSSQKDSNSATFSFGNGSAKDTSNNSGAASTFAFGSAASKVSKPESTFSFGGKTTETNDTTSEKSNDSDKIESSGFKGFGSTASLEKKEDAPTKPAPAINPLPIISNPIVMPKSNKWSCSVCMIQNDQDKDSCACCSEPKPGSKPKAAEPVKPALGGVITSSGFKFGSSTPSSNPSAAVSGFIFGSSKTNSESSNSNSNTAQTSNVVEAVKKPDEYSKEFLAHLKALNVQVSAWIKTHIEKNPYVFLTPVFKDYEKHIKDIEEKFKNTKSSEEGSSTKEKETPAAASKPLLGAVFGSGSADSTPKTSDEPVKFGTGTGFAFGSAAAKTNTVESSEKSGFSFGSSASTTDTSTKSGFSFGSAAPAKTDSESKPSAEKSEDDKKSEDKKPPSGFFGSGSSDATTKTTTGFTFGNAAEKTPSTGFTFGAKSEDSTNSATSGFSFGTGNSNAGSGFPAFGSSNGDAGGKTGFTFGSAPSTGFTGFGSAASLEKKEEAPAADAEDEPPKVEVTQVVEEDAFHTVRCKLYYMKDKAFVEKGLGMLHLKKVEGDDTKTQMVVRAETNLGNILLNILVSDKMKVTVKKNNVQFMCVPNPPIKGMEGPVMMLAKVKDSLMAEQLEAKLEEVTKTT